MVIRHQRFNITLHYGLPLLRGEDNASPLHRITTRHIRSTRKQTRDGKAAARQWLTRHAWSMLKLLDLLGRMRRSESKDGQRTLLQLGHIAALRQCLIAID